MTFDEEARITKWHVECFEEQGFSTTSILLLLDWQIDPHDTAKLVNRGCDHDVALQIVRPLEATVAAVPDEFSVRV